MAGLQLVYHTWIVYSSKHTHMGVYIYKAETIGTVKTIATRQKYNRCSDKIQEQEQDVFNNYAQCKT